MAEAESELGSLVTVTVYSDDATSETANDAETVPSEIEQVEAVAAVLDT